MPQSRMLAMPTLRWCELLSGFQTAKMTVMGVYPASPFREDMP